LETKRKRFEEVMIDGKKIADFWEEQWLEGGGLKPGQKFDKERPHLMLDWIIQEKLIDAKNERSEPKSILIPGCGRGYDPAFFGLHGLNATGMDISPTAVIAANEYLASFKAKNPGAELSKVISGNFFENDGSSFDYVYDYTFFCAIDPSLREAWGKRMAELVKPGGKLITMIFPVVEKQGGPPFQVKIEDVRMLLEKNGFENLLLKPVPKEMSPEGRDGKEHLAIWLKL